MHVIKKNFSGPVNIQTSRGKKKLEELSNAPYYWLFFFLMTFKQGENTFENISRSPEKFKDHYGTRSILCAT